VSAFLSPEWIRDLDAIARSSTALAAPDGTSLVIEQHVEGTPQGDVVYHLVIGRDPGVVSGSADHPDVVFVTDYETATDLHAGRINAQDAIAAGRLKLRGHLDVLLRHADVLSAVGDVFRALRADTEPARDEEHRR
jgi:hypothetical protein